ncbi:MAG: winged helix-turn-helix transcriptional regulator [Lachnospiraceae bacterium]|nr:winged helix-turn-helix transcriptional regulator [Lachnospiraceae bacterium]
MKACSSRDMKRFNHLLGEIEAVYHEMALKFGQSDSVMNILYTICDYGDSCPLQEICRRSGISKQTINSALRKLEREGIVYSEQAGVKGKNVCLTEKGKELAGDTAVRVIEAENGILASWPEEDVKRYLELTERFLVGIKEKAKEINTGSL